MSTRLLSPWSKYPFWQYGELHRNILGTAGLTLKYAPIKLPNFVKGNVIQLLCNNRDYCLFPGIGFQSPTDPGQNTSPFIAVIFAASAVRQGSLRTAGCRGGGGEGGGYGWRGWFCCSCCLSLVLVVVVFVVVLWWIYLFIVSATCAELTCSHPGDDNIITHCTYLLSELTIS